MKTHPLSYVKKYSKFILSNYKTHVGFPLVHLVSWPCMRAPWTGNPSHGPVLVTDYPASFSDIMDPLHRNSPVSIIYLLSSSTMTNTKKVNPTRILSWYDSYCSGGHRDRRHCCRPSYLVQHTDDYTTPHFSIQGSIIEHTLPTINNVIDQKISNLPCIENYSAFSHLCQKLCK